MKQLVILSGKGGTGKTTVSAALIALSKATAAADCDVDAPNLGLVVPPLPVKRQSTYYGLPQASVEQERCTRCGACASVCRFDAISYDGTTYCVDPFSCEGCRTCSLVCPSGAVRFAKQASGTVTVRQSGNMTFAAAELAAGSGNTGKLVSEVKACLLGEAKDEPVAVVDGSPGIGCPVIASLSGACLALLVTEPSLSALSDLKRAAAAALQFSVPTAVCINKYDIDETIAKTIEAYCENEGIPVVGRLAYDPAIPHILDGGGNPADIEGETGSAMRRIWRATKALLEKDGKP